MATLIQADYERLLLIANRFTQQAEAHQQFKQTLQRQADTLLGGNWVGHGSAAFEAEMGSDIYPALNRLVTALHRSQQTTIEIITALQTAEEEAAQPFAHPVDQISANANGTGTSDLPYTLGNGQSPRTISASSNPTGWERPTEAEIEALFTPERMDELIDYHHPVANPEAMGNTMQELFRVPPLEPNAAETQALLQEMAQAYGNNTSVDYLQEQYERYTVLFAEAHGNWPGPELPYSLPVSIHHPLHDITVGDNSFWGSTWQMRYGKVSGDALGIDPVFAAMLNPTGGLVGKGNQALALGENEGLGYHGTVHDAAGYLYNHHQIGPGYDYLGQENGRSTGDPLTGQSSGIPYWNDRMPGSTTVEFYSDLGAPFMGAFNDYGWGFLGDQPRTLALWEGLTNLFDF